ncbi:homing endonuclease associated repeat-containing protein [Halorussus salinisoli]|uniref:homing endonuclease associated repeat-containing protein n=1 Tax=Halorussus salinisoli TaxID=2558242 RepID=UPI0010C24553|nr:hypothetical protein [Halorussus salinisoli]
MPHLSEEELREELRLLAWRLQRIPRTKDMQTIGRYSAETYLDRFGDWGTALEAAGVADRREPNLSRPRLQRHLQELGDRLGRTPTRTDLREEGDLSSWVYIDNFKSWRAVLERAGFDIVPRTSPAEATVTHNQLRTILAEIADEIGRTPSQDELDRYGDYASDIYCAAFGSWDDALQLAGLTEHSLHGAPTYSTSELLNHLRDLATRLGETPTAREMNTNGEHAVDTYRHRFGSWNNALQKAGFTSTTSASLPPADDLLTEIRRLKTEFGQPPTPAKMRQQGKYTPELYLSRFDSWNRAVEEAGYNPAHAWNR